MRVDDPQHGEHDHGFGLGAHQPELHDVGADTHPGDAHGLFDHVGESAAAAAALGGHVEIGHLDHDFAQHHDGLDGLHDSVHASLGLGFGGDEHHSLHEGLHESTLHEHHDVEHDHGLLHDVAHPQGHDIAHDTHHDLGLGFHG